MIHQGATEHVPGRELNANIPVSTLCRSFPLTYRTLRDTLSTRKGESGFLLYRSSGSATALRGMSGKGGEGTQHMAFSFFFSFQVSQVHTFHDKDACEERG